MTNTPTHPTTPHPQQDIIMNQVQQTSNTSHAIKAILGMTDDQLGMVHFDLGCDYLTRIREPRAMIQLKKDKRYWLWVNCIIENNTDAFIRVWGDAAPDTEDYTQYMRLRLANYSVNETTLKLVASDYNALAKSVRKNSKAQATEQPTAHSDNGSETTAGGFPVKNALADIYFIIQDEMMKIGYPDVFNIKQDIGGHIHRADIDILFYHIIDSPCAYVFPKFSEWYRISALLMLYITLSKYKMEFNRNERLTGDIRDEYFAQMRDLAPGFYNGDNHAPDNVI